MKLFKKRKTKGLTTNEIPAVTETRTTNLTKSNEPQVEEEGNNFIMFVDSNQKYYLCIDNNFKDCIHFDSYTKSSSHDAYILKRGELFALLYFVSDICSKWKVTDFTFVKVDKDKDKITLYTQDNEKYIYMYRTLISDVLSYTLCEFNLVLVKHRDFDELYYIYFKTSLKFLFSAKSIELTYVFTDCARSLFKYKKSENEFGYFISNGYEIVTDYSKKYNKYYRSINLFFNNKHIYILTGTNDDGKKCIFNMFAPNKVSDYYDDIQNINLLFLCRKDNHFDIVDMCMNTYFRYATSEGEKLSLSYDTVQAKYILRNEVGAKIISLYLYESSNINSIYAIFYDDDEYGLFYDDNRKFAMACFIKKIKDIYEFKDLYLLSRYSYYAWFRKEADVNTIYDNISSPYLLKLEYFDKDTSINLDDKYITLLQKCNVSSIDDLTKEDDSIVIYASTPIGNIIIKDGKIQADVVTGEKFEIDESDIKTTLVDYIFENTENKFSLAYLKYELDD